MSDLRKWERKVLKGDFNAIPKPFRWNQSAPLAHFLNGYEVAGGFDQLSTIASRISDRARETGRWKGSARDLWLCLYFQHRAQRHLGMDYDDPALDDLCEALRVALIELSTRDAMAITSKFCPSP